VRSGDMAPPGWTRLIVFILKHSMSTTLLREGKAGFGGPAAPHPCQTLSQGCQLGTDARWSGEKFGQRLMGSPTPLRTGSRQSRQAPNNQAPPRKGRQFLIA